MKALVLTYHSHNISGTTYESNDHVALATDLRVLTGLGARIVPLARIVRALHARLEGEGLLVGLTFDDGPTFDFADFTHARFGRQRSFFNILRDFDVELGPRAQPELHATSFVIASPEARAAMERADDCGYTDLGAWLADDWWSVATDSGLMAIGNHSWDHVHHAVPRTAIAKEGRDDFHLVDNADDADREIRAATQFIRSKNAGRCEHFAFPFGHAPRYLVEDYLPGHVERHGMSAAFGVEGRALRADDSPWNIPRLVCGYHWRSPEALETLVISVA
jgi:hypothetical protein